MEIKAPTGLVIHTIQHLTDLGPLAEELKNRGYPVYLFAFANKNFKPQINVFLKQKYLQTFPHDKIIWYDNNQDLDLKIRAANVKKVFTEEVIPFVLEPKIFQTRNYKIYSVVHMSDNFHRPAAAAGIIDQSFVAYQKYGELYGYKPGTFTALGLPKYDVISKLNKSEILKKYNLPEKFILILVPNNTLLNWLVMYKIIREVKRHGYSVVLKGKRPKCHKRIYYALAHKYFLTDLSFYPFISHELIFASSGVIGFDTTAVEEALVLGRPLVNLSVKPYREKSAQEGDFRQFGPMWKSEFCLDIPFFERGSWQGFFKPLPEFMGHFTKKFDYKKIQSEVFSIPGEASKKVVDYLEKQL